MAGSANLGQHGRDVLKESGKQIEKQNNRPAVDLQVREFDVAAGQFSLFSQVGVGGGYLKAYVKPMFGGLEVYDYRKDKNTPVLHQAKELLLRGASHVFKNWRTQQLATEVDLSGKLSSLGISTWQAIGEVPHNAFIQAILPGFDRAVRRTVASNAHNPPWAPGADGQGQYPK